MTSSLKALRINQLMRTFLLAGFLLVLMLILAGCGGDDDKKVFITGPGLVGIDDSIENTAPLLTVTYAVPPSPVLITADILSDPSSDGDIAYDEVLNTFTVTLGPSLVFFGEDSSRSNRPEFRAFLTFPLDGITGQPVVPSNGVIVSAFLEIFVKKVKFASVIPTFLDLVHYPFRGLSAVDFNSPILTPTSFMTLDFFSADRRNFVSIDVTSFMQEVQLPPALSDLQVRFSVGTAALLSSRAFSVEASRSVYSPPRSPDRILHNREASSAKTFRHEALESRSR
jgi:hypothetical protein